MYHPAQGRRINAGFPGDLVQAFATGLEMFSDFIEYHIKHYTRYIVERQ